MRFTIEVQNTAVNAALERIQGSLVNLSPVMQCLGEDIMARTKARFGASTGPDDRPWAPNSPVTLLRYIRSRSGEASKMKGKARAKAATLAISKRPLLGLGGELPELLAINGKAAGDVLTVILEIDS